VFNAVWYCGRSNHCHEWYRLWPSGQRLAEKH